MALTLTDRRKILTELKLIYRHMKFFNYYGALKLVRELVDKLEKEQDAWDQYDAELKDILK